jgi:hypothetical protein
MKFATRNTSAVLAAGALLATAPVSASLPELSNERPLEIVEVVEKMLPKPAYGMAALEQIRLELDKSLTRQTEGVLLAAVRTGFESASVALESVEVQPDDEEREEVAAQISVPDAFRFSALEISDDSDFPVLAF